MLTGGLLALLAAATFAMNNAAYRRGALTATVAQAMAISLVVGLLMFGLAVLLVGAWDDLAAFPPFSVLLLVVSGALHFGWGRYCNFRATKAMGANLVGPPQQSSLIVTLLLAILVLGEALTPLRILGILLVVLGPAMSFQRRKGRARPALSTRSGFKPNLVEGYTFAFLSATGYGASPVMVRYALEGQGVAASIAGGFIASVAALATLSLVLMRPGMWAHLREVKPGASRWFIASAALVALSQMFGYMALAFAPVSVVTPIQRLSLVLRVFANSLINRDHEVIGGRVWVATFVALLGALCLSVSTETVLNLISLPDWLEALARWQWPAA